MSSTSEEAKKDKVGASTTSKRKRQHSRRTELDIRATVSKKKDGSRDLMKEKRQDKHRQKKARQNRLKASKWKLPQSFGHNDCDDSDFRSVDDSEEEKEVVKAYDLVSSRVPVPYIQKAGPILTRQSLPVAGNKQAACNFQHSCQPVFSARG